MKTFSNILAFSGHNLLAEGPLSEVAVKIKKYMIQIDKGDTLLFDGTSGKQIDIDLRGTESELVKRFGPVDDEGAASQVSNAPKPRGRPKLGVVGREVTLLPRHWQWLDTQRGGASATLRRLVDQERKQGAEAEQIRLSQDSANRFMYVMAGNLAGFEEAVRALYARDGKRFRQETECWPVDIRSCAQKFAELALN